MSLVQTLSFFRRYLSAPAVVGAVAPSSRALAAALAEPFSRRGGPSVVLEVGAGTGAVTRAIAAAMGPQDRLDICEVQPKFADTLERTLIDEGPLHAAHNQGRVRLLRTAVQTLEETNRYDYVIAGLPFTVFSAQDVEAVFEVIRRSMKPGGVFSYFEYVGIRRLTRSITPGAKGRNLRAVSRILDEHIGRHEVDRRRVWLNLPPAYARHWRFSPA